MTTKSRTKTAEEEATSPDVAAPETQQLAVITPEERAAAHNAAAMTKQTNDKHMQDFMQWLVDTAASTDEDQYAIMASIMGEIMAAENPAEVMKEKSTVTAADVVGRPFLLHSFEIRAGDYEESLFQHYAAMTISPPGTATTRILTTGAAKVLMKLYALSQFDEWPQPIMFTSKQGKKGNVLDIVSY